MNRAACLAVLLVSVPSAVVLAQGYLQPSMIRTPSGLCLDLAGDFNHASPPPVGTHVIVATCDGSDAQRWNISMGDYQGMLMSIGGHSVGGDATHAALVAQTQSSRLIDAAIHVGGSCATTPVNAHAGDAVMIKPCNGSPEQRFDSSELARR